MYGPDNREFVYKPENVKILHAFSHCPSSTGGGYVSYYRMYGLGDNGVIYEYNEYKKDWYTRETRSTTDSIEPQTVIGVSSPSKE